MNWIWKWENEKKKKIFFFWKFFVTLLNDSDIFPQQTYKTIILNEKKKDNK